MIVGSINEDRKIESRVAITPDNVKKFIGLGLKVLIEKNYAGHLGIDDNEYVSSGTTTFVFDSEETQIDRL